MVVIIVGVTKGLTWELQRLVELGGLSKLVLIFPPIETYYLRERWAQVSNQLAGYGVPALPSHVDLGRTRAIFFEAQGDPHVITGEKRDD